MNSNNNNNINVKNENIISDDKFERRKTDDIEEDYDDFDKDFDEVNKTKKNAKEKDLFNDDDDDNKKMNNIDDINNKNENDDFLNDNKFMGNYDFNKKGSNNELGGFDK